MTIAFTARPGTSARTRQCGFSLLELVIVCAVTLILMVIAAPAVIATVSNFQARSSMGSLSGLFQNCRTTAVKTNRIKWLRFQSSGGRWFAFIDDATSTTALDSLKPQVLLPVGFSKSDMPSGAGSPPPLDAATMWGSADTGTAASSPRSDLDTYFNQLGTPCTYSGGNCTNQSFVYYFTYRSPSPRWAAIAVSPAGRIKAFYWNGTAWGD